MSDEQQELFQGYRHLITHNRKRNIIPADIPKGAHHQPRKVNVKPESLSARFPPMPRLPTSIRKRVLVRRDKAAMFKAKVEAAIRILGPESGIVVRLADAPPQAPRAEAGDRHADGQSPMFKKPGTGRRQLPRV